MRSVLRYRRIAHRWVVRGSRWDDVLAATVPLVPVLAWPDDAGGYRDLMVDSSPQITRLETEYRERSIGPTDAAADNATTFVDVDTLVTTDWLTSELGAGDLVVLDCTVFLRMGDNGYISESGLANFEGGHIPGAAFADLNEALVDTTSLLRYAVPTPEHFGAAMERLGVSDGTRVVLYDDNSSMWAARVWFMLRWIGFDSAALLDGGLKAWRAEGRALHTGSPAPTPVAPGSLTLRPRPRLIADKQDVMAAMADGASCLIDALPAAVFSGEVQPYARPGHIPGALNIAATSMVDAETGLFRPEAEIRAALPDRPEARTVAY